MCTLAEEVMDVVVNMEESSNASSVVASQRPNLAPVLENEN